MARALLSSLDIWWQNHIWPLIFLWGICTLLFLVARLRNFTTKKNDVHDRSRIFFPFYCNCFKLILTWWVPLSLRAPNLTTLVSFKCISIDVFDLVLLIFFLPVFLFFVATLALVLLIDVTTLMQSSRKITNCCCSLFVDSRFLDDTLFANSRFLENIDYLQLQMKKLTSIKRIIAIVEVRDYGSKYLHAMDVEYQYVVGHC